MLTLVYGRKKRVFPILDNLWAFHLKGVKNSIKKNADNIQVFYLPGYSPKLNFDDLLNADREQRVTKVAPPRTKMSQARTAVDILRSIQKQPRRLKLYFVYKHACYAA